MSLLTVAELVNTSIGSSVLATLSGSPPGKSSVVLALVYLLWPEWLIGALPVDPVVNLAALPVGRCEDGAPWLLRLLGSHLLIAGATGSGKGSVIWSAVRALLPAILGGWVQVWALDPKRMEQSFGRDLFTRYADTAAAMVGLLEDAVSEMHDRAAKFAGTTRTFTPSLEFRSW